MFDSSSFAAHMFNYKDDRVEKRKSADFVVS